MDFKQKAHELVAQMTTEEKLSFLTTHHRPVERLGIKEFIVGTEIARGFVGRKPEYYSTVFPQPIGLAGTFDTELMERIGEIAGNETRAYYNEEGVSPFLFGCTVDMERHPFWGRTEEAYGEDVCLAGEMTRAYTNGLTGDDEKYCKTIPALKHFCANNNEHNRGGCNAYLPLRLKYEYYYSAFENAIKYGGAKCVMAAYNKVNGIPSLCNPEINNILMDEWGIWFGITDGGALVMNKTEHEYCETLSETFAEAVRAGCYIMLEAEEITINAGKKALEKGLISEKEIDNAAESVVYMRLKLGELADDCKYNNITKSVLDDKNSAEINLRATREQVVLLKNNGILPLKEKPRKIAVIGALADENLRDWYTGYFKNAVSIVEGIRREFPEAEVVFDNMWDIVSIKAENGKYISVHEDGTVKADADEITDSELFELQNWGGNYNNLLSVKYKKYLTYAERTLKLGKSEIYSWFTYETFNIFNNQDGGAIIEEYRTNKRLSCSASGELSFIEHNPISKNCSFIILGNENKAEKIKLFSENSDLVIYCTGNHPLQYARETTDRESISINVQKDAISHIKSENIVAVIVSSYPYAPDDSEYGKTSAIMYTTHAGAHLGTAVAETISGKNNPSGRLAMTWYKSDLDLPDIMNYDIESAGLTYMYFKGTPLYPFGYGLSYSEFEYKNLTVSGNKATVMLENISEKDGDEVIQLYFSVPDSEVSRPLKKLCSFARVNLRAHEEKTVTLEINPDIFRIFDVRSKKMITESGKYVFMAGGSSDNLPLSFEYEINGEKIAERKDYFEAQYADISHNVEICWSKSLRRQYIYSKSWESRVVYSGISFKNKLKIKASSIMGNRSIYFNIGGKDYKIDLSASDSYDDFSEYEISTEKTGSDTLTIFMPDNVCILDISIE